MTQKFRLAALIVLLLVPVNALALNEIINIRHWVAPDHTRVVIDTRDEPRYTVSKSAETIVLDFPGMVLPRGKGRTQVLNKPGIRKIWLQERPEPGVRIELHLAAHTETKVFPLKAVEDKPFRVVVDIELPEAAKEETQAREKARVLKKDRIIVIDPGHGGEAPGAVGKGGTLEKHVVLAISKRLRDALNRREGYRAYLTRKGDYYVPFKKRLQIAKEYGADLFISVHADAEKSRQARGMSVYCLSTGGASNEAARLLARSENLADVIGGVANGEANEESEAVLLNMFQTHTINQSRTYAAGILKGMEDFAPLKFESVQEAPFRVLKSPEIPSLLIETAYISNPEEERLLRRTSYQKSLADALARAIVESLPPPGEQAPARTDVAGRAPDVRDAGTGGRGDVSGPPEGRATVVLPSFALYRVKRGETLATIARKVEVPPERLRRMNGFARRETPVPGRYLKVPLTPPEKDGGADRPPAHAGEPGGKVRETTAPRSAKYVVQRGDTLRTIAGRYGLTVAELKDVNDWRPGMRLQAGRTIVVPSPGSAPGRRRAAASRDTGATPGGKPQETFVYRVRKGDGLERIARRFGTDVETVCRLNNLRQDRPLYMDRELILPGKPPR